ncbi:response regulator transcription factor [Nocardioides pocheonensis]|uniref:DNA-binding response regulator n=1 Tax=Nocardioides pocheonensis TaxID=661485 RepID=A0A3N0GV20_9ACTN|nr:response regulator transcription factor [Nocardioides pocheonensis]RNM16259.1 DNA-binding response regulator [Nocardioides pocheonensis]
MTRVLVVDDEPAIRRALELGLRAQGHDVLIAADGRTALQACREDAPDVVLLDLGLPDRSGFDVLRALREWSSIPVIVVSARHGSHDKVDALDLGADDYVTKPFGMDELMARLRAAVRRAATADRVVTEHFVVDLGAQQVTRDGVPVRLTPTEWALLAALVSRQGQLVSRERLLHEVWGPAYGVETNYLRVFVANLRKKLEPEPSRPRYLHTEPGMGYRFTAE